MRIAVNTLLSGKHQADFTGYLMNEVFYRLVTLQNEHQFIFFVDAPVNPALASFKNVVVIIMAQQPVRSSIFLRWGHGVKFSWTLKKHKPDILVNIHGKCPIGVAIPQVLMINDLVFLNFPLHLPKMEVYRKTRNTPACIKKARLIITLSAHTKQQIEEQYNVPADKVVNMECSARTGYGPLDWKEKQSIKDQFADGCEYFLFIGDFQPLNNLVNLLKAFTIFKARQRSNMKMVIIGDVDSNVQDAVKLRTYKFKNDLKIYTRLDEVETTQLVGAAYALVNPSFFERFGVKALEAMQSEVPLIVTKTGNLNEIAGEAALYVTPEEPSDIAEQLKLIYKDENLRNMLIKKGKQQAERFTWQNTIGRMWLAIEKAISK